MHDAHFGPDGFSLRDGTGYNAREPNLANVSAPSLRDPCALAEVVACAEQLNVSCND